MSDENRARSISIRFFFKITDQCVEKPHLLCSHDPIFGTNKKSDPVNGPLYKAIRESFFTFCNSKDLNSGSKVDTVLKYIFINDFLF